MDQSVRPNFEVDTRLDITRDFCPMTYVRVRLALDRMQSGQMLLVALRGDEPLRNVPRSAVEQGHTVAAKESGDGDVTLLWIRKG